MSNNQISLANLVGTDILAKIPTFKNGAMVSLKLVAVESSGIWIESEDFMEDMLAGTPHTMTAKTFQIFLPFAQILAIYSLADTPWLSKRIAD
jgi:hypothetical protein